MTSWCHCRAVLWWNPGAKIEHRENCPWKPADTVAKGGLLARFRGFFRR